MADLKEEEPTDLRRTAESRRTERYQHALLILKKLRENDYVAVFAGGFVRDKLLNRPEKDIDIVTNAYPEAIKAIFSEGFKLVLDGEKHGVIRVGVPGHDFIDVSTLRTEGSYSDGRRPDSVQFTNSLRRDAARRDFTVNAMYWDPQFHEGDVWDFHGGLKDLKKQKIRCVGDAPERFDEDGLRILRAFRLSFQLNFKIANRTMNAISVRSLESISGERIWSEFSKILELSHGFWYFSRFEILQRLGVLGQILPEVAELSGLKQDSIHHPEGDAFTHTLYAFAHLPKNASVLLKLATLLHDIGKACCIETYVDAEGRKRRRHPEHAEEGSIMADAVCQRFKMSNEERTHVVALVRDHMKAHFGRELRTGKLMQWMREPHFEDLMRLQHVDALASAYGMDGSLFSFYLSKKQELEEKMKTPPLVTGKALIAAGFVPGVYFTQLLADCQEAQDESRISTVEEGILMAEDWYRLYEHS